LNSSALKLNFAGSKLRTGVFADMRKIDSARASVETLLRPARIATTPRKGVARSVQVLDNVFMWTAPERTERMNGRSARRSILRAPAGLDKVLLRLSRVLNFIRRKEP